MLNHIRLLHYFFNSAHVMATDGAAKIFLPPMPQRDLNPLQKSCSRLGHLKDVLPTELQRRDRLSDHHTKNFIYGTIAFPIIDSKLVLVN